MLLPSLSSGSGHRFFVGDKERFMILAPDFLIGHLLEETSCKEQEKSHIASTFSIT